MGSKESGRRPKYNAELHATIIKHLEIGAFPSHAAQAAGISWDTLENWLARGRTGEEPYAQLTADAEQAIAKDAIRNQTIISKAAAGAHEGDWKAAAWNLEKKHPRLYGRLAELLAVAKMERPISPFKQRPPEAAPEEPSVH